MALQKIILICEGKLNLFSIAVFLSLTLRGKDAMWSVQTDVYIISQAIYQHFIARGNPYLRSKLSVCECFVWFFFADATATYITLEKSSLLKKKIVSFYSTFSCHSKKVVGCAMMLMPRRTGVWTGD